ncbi:MAG: R3H domain-containing nucleic acid-binding protein [Patescibacteria group bacterium]
MNQNRETISEILKTITGFMKLDCRIEIIEENTEGSKGLFISLYAPENARFLIGRNGQNLKALEHLIRLVCSKVEQEPRAISVDVNDYKKAKTQYAVELARQALNRVRDNQKAEALAPMSAYERRVVHMELASCPDVTTESIGEEPQRRIVIKPFSLN